MLNERGSSRVGCLLIIFVILLISVVGYHIGPVYLDKIAFEDALSGIANKAGAEAWAEKTIVEHAVSTARSFQFNLDRRDVKIEVASRFQSASRLMIRVKVTRSIDVFGYRHTFQFEPEVEALQGRL
ncbi:MAG: hypothetical protein JSU96_01270 [Acidobacteriota bacterium]|nr:MAG: hypothetical protein JSU96_01270 [Acidobacteriota bacterium]